jgi:hypothetical protein
MARPAPFLAALLLAGVVALVGGGCFNDAFRGPEFNGDVGATRFALVIESDRTAIDGSHFLVDQATGDLWVLDARPGSVGGWLRLAEGPSDAKPLRELRAESQEQEEPEAQD